MEYTKLLGKVTLTANGYHSSDLAYDRLSLVYDQDYRSFISIKDVPENIDINNEEYWLPLSVVSADGEDLKIGEGLFLRLANRNYDPLTNSGMGYIILRKYGSYNILSAHSFVPHSLHVIRYDFDLNGETITLPEGCALYFEGGTLNNGTIIGTDTIIYGTYRNSGDACFEGTWLYEGNMQEILPLIDIIKELELKVSPYRLVVTGDGVFKKGLNTNVSVTWRLMRGDTAVKPDIVTINGEDIPSYLGAKVFMDVDRTTQYVVSCTIDDITISEVVTANFVDPSYFGVVPSSFLATEVNIKGLGSGEIIKDSKEYITPKFTLNGLLNCYAYPKEFGELQSITDIHGNQIKQVYKMMEVRVDGELYYVYLLLLPTTVLNYVIDFK